MKKINYLSTLIIFSFCGLVMRGQDIHFSQVHETPLFLSPANTGFYNGYFRAIANYRNQWASMNNAFQTMALSMDGGIFKSKKRPAFLGIGFTLFSDVAGVAKLRKTTAMLHVSGLLKLGKKSALSVGLAGGAAGTSASYNELTYASQFNGNSLDPTLSSGEPSIYRPFTTVDVGAGIAYEFATFSKDQDHDDEMSFKVAFGAYHLNQAVQEYGPGSKYKEPIRLTGAITSVIDVEDTKFTVTPSIIFQQQAGYQELVLGSYIKYRVSTGTKVTGSKTQNAIGLGLYYRNKDALIPKLIFDMGDYSVGMSYDVNLSGYHTASNYMGGFEVSLRYNNLASSLFETRREFR